MKDITIRLSKKRYSILFFLISGFFLLLNLVSYSQSFNYPGNYIITVDAVLDNDHISTGFETDIYGFNYLFNKENQPISSVKANRPQSKVTDFKREFKVKRNVLEIIKFKLTVDEIFSFSRIFTQMNTPQLALSSLGQGFLFDYDLHLDTSLASRMKGNSFFNKYGEAITSLGDAGADLIIAELFSLSGTPKGREVAQMIAESAIDLRTQFLKRLIGRSRPSDEISTMGPSLQFDSFPSGHTSSAFATATIIGEAYDLKWLTYPLAALVALTRVQLDTHWPSDLLAGGLIGHLSARKIMYDHGYISTLNIFEGPFWKNTDVRVKTNYNVDYDTNENFNPTYPYTDRVAGRQIKSFISQKLSETSLLQLSYHNIGKLPLVYTNNSTVDVLGSVRYSVGLNKNFSGFIDYTGNKINYNQLGVAPYNRVSFPSDYAPGFINANGQAGIFYNIDNYHYVKCGISSYDTNVPCYSYINAGGFNYEITIGRVPVKDRFLSGFISYRYYTDNNFGSIYQKSSNNFTASLKGRLTDDISGSILLSNENQFFPGYPAGAGTANWNVYGFEFEKDFNYGWGIRAGIYNKNLNSNINQWSYSRTDYVMQLKADL